LAARRERLAKPSVTGSMQPGSDVEQPPAYVEAASSIPILPDANGHGAFIDAPYVHGDLVITGAPDQHASDLADDPYVDLYYKCFHSFHPFVLPRHRLLLYSQDVTKEASLRPVISCMRHIGSLYAHPSYTAQLAQQAAGDIDTARLTSPSCPYLCQALLLYSVVLFWTSDRPLSQSYMNDAVRLATSLGMSRQEFANANSHGDPVLAESWRRTWWQLYIVDVNYAAIKRDTEFPTRDVPVTVDLPCEEDEYISGVCQTCRHACLLRTLTHVFLSTSRRRRRSTTLIRESFQTKTTSSRHSHISSAQ
jgi:hypothetical protein